MAFLKGPPPTYNATPRGPIGEELRRLEVPVTKMAKACRCSDKTAWRWAMGESKPMKHYRRAVERFFAKVSPDFDIKKALDG